MWNTTMTATGILIMLLGIFLLANSLNGNLGRVASGEYSLNFNPNIQKQPSSGISPNSPAAKQFG